MALPDSVRDTTPPAFEHLASLPTFSSDGVSVTVMAGSLAGHTSAAPTFSPLVGAEIRLSAGGRISLPLEPGFEHAVLAVDGDVSVDGVVVDRHRLAWLGAGRAALELAAAGDATVLLLGGAPFEEELVMWWNLIGRSHDEIVEQRDAWNGTGIDFVPPRYGHVADFPGPRLLAPPLPSTRLKPRGR